MNYHNITYDDMLNGDGLRVVLWVSGCTHCCKGCHNPITWSVHDGIKFDESAKLELYEHLAKPHIKGITFSGGDPLHPVNVDEITKLAKDIKCKFPNKDIWLYTGFVFEDILTLEILEYVDVLVDGKFIEELKDNKIKWCGSSNQRVIRLSKN